MGGDLLATGCAAVTFPLPLDALQGTSVHGHCFLQCGTLLPVASPGALAHLVPSLRLAAGLGVVLPTRLGRLEVNYCVPLRYQEHDRVRHGVQVGLRDAQNLTHA
jgi:outer membrane protein insertion porin family